MGYRKFLKSVCSLGAVFVISACGGGGGGGSYTPGTSSPAKTLAQGVAVDPVIVGAVFQEVAGDGVTILQRQSTPSDANGVFTFPNPFTAGSTVEMKISNKGLHAGAPFQGLLRRSISAADSLNVTVTPLTTMLANGLQPTDAITALGNAGFAGMTTGDLYANPMNGLANLTAGVTDQQLRVLQAAMAVEAYMEITGKYQPTLSDITSVSQAQILNSMGAAVRATLSAAQFAKVSAALASDPQMTGPLTLGDLIMAVVQEQRTMVSLVKTDMATSGVFDPAMVTQNVASAQAQIQGMAKSQFMTRMNQQPAPAADGAALYATNCAGCHGALASSSKKGRTAAQIQAAITANLGGMGSLGSLTSSEVQAIATALSGVTPTPTPVDGPTLYSNNCAGCHGALASSTKLGRTAAQIQAAITGNIGGMGSLSTLTATQIQAIATALAGVTPPPTPADGPTLYANNCAGCHGALASTTKPGRTAAQIQAAITSNIGGMGSLSSLTATQIQAIANALPAAPPPTPGTPPDGVALYNSECAGCHGALASTTKPGRTAAQIQAAITNNTGGMGALSILTAAEIQAIAAALPAAPPPPVTPPNGTTLYTNNCAGCHGALASTTKPGRTAAQIQAAITNNTGGMGYLSTLTAAEIQAIAAVLPAAPPPPVTPPSGATLYANNCAGCHGALASTTKPGRTAAQIQAAITSNTGGMGYLSTLTAAEIQAIAAALPAAPPGGIDYSNCTACHGQPPSGSSYPNVAGRHAVHTTLPSINNNCAVCHAGAAHNGTVDLGVAATFKAKTGTLAVNATAMTCSAVSCHGGQTTPNWQTGSIAVDTQCTSCHASGTSQYNSYASGQHSRHIGQGYACTVCHNTTKLVSGHFSNLATSAFEQDPAATIGGGSTSITSYAPSATVMTSGSCSPKCHGTETW